MQIHWFQNEDHLVYINGATQLADLERTLHFPGLEEAANALRLHPTPEGLTIKGPKHLLFHGRDAGMLCDLLARCTRSQVKGAIP